MFCEKHYSMTIWFWHQVSSSSFCCDNFNISVFSKFFQKFSKKCISDPLKKNLFQNHFLLFFLDLYSELWFNLITLWTFFKTNSLFNACFKPLMWIRYSVFSCKLATSFYTFQLSFFFVKMVNHYEILRFFAYWTSYSRTYPFLSLTSL